MNASAETGAAGDGHFSVHRLIFETGPGLLLCVAIALPVYEISKLSVSLDPLALSLILGMVLGNVLGPAAQRQPGVTAATAIFVPTGILLYGTRLDFQTFSQLPVFSTMAVLAAVASFFLVMLMGGRALRIDKSTGLLIASGSAICGAAAIAVLAPVVGARNRNTSVALIIITTVALTGALLYPLIGDILSLPATTYGFFCGATLQQIGIVRLAAAHMGKEALATAVTVKMMRIAMLAPISLILGATASFAGKGRVEKVSVRKKRNRAPVGPAAGRSGGVPAAWQTGVSRAWFLPLFVAVAALFSFFQPATSIRESLKPLATICMSTALSSIGLTVNFESIKLSGSRPLLLGFAGWGLVCVFFLLAVIPMFSLGG